MGGYQMYNVIWVIDYTGNSCFRATVSQSSDFLEEFTRFSNGIVDTDLTSLRNICNEITKETVDSFDHYGKFIESLNIRFEFTENAIDYCQNQLRSRSCLGCLFTILISWFVIHYGIIITKWLITTVGPTIKAFFILILISLLQI